jgi:hypothetical protein
MSWGSGKGLGRAESSGGGGGLERNVVFEGLPAEAATSFASL